MILCTCGRLGPLLMAMLAMAPPGPGPGPGPGPAVGGGGCGGGGIECWGAAGGRGGGCIRLGEDAKGSIGC